MSRLAWLAAGTAASVSGALWYSARRHEQAVSSLAQRLAQAPASAPLPADDNLPPPVARYLRWADPEGSELTLVRLQQEGSVRSDVRGERWMPFTATHVVAASGPGFVWHARVKVAPLVHVRVLDALVDGVGSTEVRLLSAIPLAHDAGTPEMHSGSLHRYLAEAPWYPPALRPSDRLTWAPIDEIRALATLRDLGTTVSLEFRFDDSGAIAGIYTPARWGSFTGGYRQVPWEGHFRKYRRYQGVAVPTDADVGWYIDGSWRPVWKGRITDFAAD